MLKVSQQGKQKCAGLMESKELQIGLCRYLWTMPAGKASVRVIL
jgi:hypothetical protein